MGRCFRDGSAHWTDREHRNRVARGNKERRTHVKARLRAADAAFEHVYEMKDGKIARFENNIVDQDAWAAAWS